MAETLTLPDGRKIDYLISGSADGFPLVFLHGTPGAYIPFPDLVVFCEKKGLKLITPSRAGYGGSSRNKGRRIVDEAADIQAVLDHLGIKECVVSGISGGGPSVLACAARLRGCLAALSICSPGPYGVEGLDFTAGQNPDNLEENAAALEGEESLQKLFTVKRPGMLAVKAEDFLADESTPEVDKKALRENESFGETFVEILHEALRVSADGIVDDELAFVSPWGFELSEIQIPVAIWQGDADTSVPFAHGKWLVEHLPQDQVKSHLLPREGHSSIFLNHMVDMFEELLQAAGK